jgi:hypothetical protein
LDKLIDALEQEQPPEIVQTIGRMYVDQIELCFQKLSRLNAMIRRTTDGRF